MFRSLLKASRQPRLSWRPSFEILEDRTVPSTLAVTRAGDDISEPGTLRYAVAQAQSGDTILLASHLRNSPVVLSTANASLLL